MWIDLLKDEGAQMKSYYYGMFAKNRSGRPQRNLYIPHEWPLQNTLPDMVHKPFLPKSTLNVYTIRLHVHQLLLQVVEIMLGLTNIHLSNRGVVWKVNMAHDVLFNEVCVLHKYRITVV